MFKKLQKLHTAFLQAGEKENWDEFDTTDQAMKELLRTALEPQNLCQFNKRQLLRVLAWCSSHRPYEPHLILTKVALAAERSQKDTE